MSPSAEAPTGFAVQSPARIALDFLSTTNGLPNPWSNSTKAISDTANVVEASGRTRVVLNLKSATNYRTELDGNAVLVYLDPVKTASAVAPISTVQVTPARPRWHRPDESIRDVDFRRTSDGAGRPGGSPGLAGASADVRNEGKGLVVELSALQPA